MDEQGTESSQEAKSLNHFKNKFKEHTRFKKNSKLLFRRVQNESYPDQKVKQLKAIFVRLLLHCKTLRVVSTKSPCCTSISLLRKNSIYQLRWAGFYDSPTKMPSNCLQLFRQTLTYVLLWKDFADEIKVPDQLITSLKLPWTRPPCSPNLSQKLVVLCVSDGHSVIINSLPRAISCIVNWGSSILNKRTRTETSGWSLSHPTHPLKGLGTYANIILQGVAFEGRSTFSTLLKGGKFLLFLGFNSWKWPDVIWKEKWKVNTIKQYTIVQNKCHNSKA